MVLILILEFCAVFFGWRAGSARRGQFVFFRGPGGCDECTYDRTPRHATIRRRYIPGGTPLLGVWIFDFSAAERKMMGDWLRMRRGM